MQISKERVIEKLRHYLFENFIFGIIQDEIKDNTSFLEMGILDSTGIVELVAYVEREFEIDVLDHEIIPENFDTLDSISIYVITRLKNK